MSLFPLRARQITLIPSCQLLLILAGRYKQVRCYSLLAVTRLCYALVGLHSPFTTAIPSVESWQNGTDTTESCYSQQSLQECYYKFSDSKDAQSIHTYHTSAFVFAAVLHKDKIALWQRHQGTHPGLFHRLREFWIPAEPRSISFADDRVALKAIVVVFHNEVTAIGLKDSKVKTVPIDQQLETLYETAWRREKYEVDSQRTAVGRHPHPPPHPHQSQSLSLSLSQSSSLGAVCPPLQWTCMIQLPFYPDQIPAASLTPDFSTPPSYATVVTTAPSEASDPIVLPSAAAPQLFFATFGTQSFMIDLAGTLFSTQCWCWLQEPEHIEFIQVLPNDWCAVGFCKDSVDMIHLATRQRAQRVMSGAIRYLGKWKSNSSGSREGGLLWSCTSKDRMFVYWLKAIVS
ncbi:hypothetical protein BDF14DRAFT_253714 [Spinellus fusiger]|nr:hypothetical protein BDF14DRAFT_253714 [Spinellus fusiger]